jgi:hypothetical protein
MEKEKMRGEEDFGRRTRLISLAILFFVNLINYMDRLTVSAVLNVSQCFSLRTLRGAESEHSRTVKN